MSHRTIIKRRDWLKALGAGGISLAGARTSHAEPNVKSRKVRGVIFMVSDGMSPGVLSMAEAFSTIHRKRGTRWWQMLSDKSTSCGLMDTASASSLVTDSAAASSAWGGGKRVENYRINIDAMGNESTPIALRLKEASNARIGLVTTATVTHATPAGFVARVANRNDEDQIAPQYLGSADVVLGGGSVFFDPDVRADRRDLWGEFRQAGYEVLRDRNALLAARGEKLLGTFTRGHLPFSIDQASNKSLQQRVPTLLEMADAALDRMLMDKRPFLLQIEGARIDHAAHLNDIGGLLHDQLAFDDTVDRVMQRCASLDDILVVVTSDHGNSNPGLNGIGARYADTNRYFHRVARLKASHERVFAEWNRNGSPQDLARHVQGLLDFQLRNDEAEALHQVLKGREVIEWNELHENPEGLLGQLIGNHTGVGWTGTTHTADPTIICAKGPGASRFSGIVKNSDVYHHLLEMLG
ncbi:MAG: alkaline phosphatase [Luteolibacter sp.]